MLCIIIFYNSIRVRIFLGTNSQDSCGTFGMYTRHCLAEPILATELNQKFLISVSTIPNGTRKILLFPLRGCPVPPLPPLVEIHFVKKNLSRMGGGGGHSGRKSRILALQDIPDISGYQLGFGRRFVKAYKMINPVTNQKII